jgi:tetratricopeptide (TPR) repeat protein
VDLTTDRAPVLKAVDEIVGQAAPASMNAFNLTPSEIVDLSALPTDSPELASVPLQMRIAEICRDSRMPLCGRMVVPDAKMMARIEEAEIARRVGGFQAMLNSLAESPRRKIVVLISAGLLHSDNASGQPQLGDIGRMVGQSAAQANAVVYSLHFDNRHLGMMGASQASMGRMPTLRDNFVVSNSLHRIADTSGGAFFNVVTGGGEHAFDRVIKETTSYYLLGVEAAASDRDGRSHQVTVKTSQKNVTLRNRSWVTLSKPVAATGLVTRTVLRTRGSAPKALPAQARPIVEAYARRDYAGATQQIARVQDLANFIRAYRAADSPWPQSPRMERVFELELALVGLMGETGFVHEEGLKLLTDAHLLVERMGPADAFACSWFLAEAAAFEGLWRPELAIAFVERAARACPGEPRLRLAHAVLLEQQWQRQREPAQVQDIVSAYKKVDGAAAAEALVRAAGLCAAAGELSDALALLQSAPVSTDPYVRYLYELTKGHVLRKQGHAEESVAAYTRALDAWPGAQSARVSLMTALMQLGRLDEAGALSEAVQTAPRMNTDPWWTYYRGDFRDYPALLANLRAIN